MSEALAQAVRASLGRPGDALFADGRWFAWSWMGRMADGLDRAAAGAPCVGLVTRNKPAHVAAIAANLAAGRGTVMIPSAQSPTALAAEIARRRLPALFADPQDWTAEALAAAEACGTDAVHIQDDGIWTLRALPRAAASASSAPAFELPSSGTTGPPKRVPLGWETLARMVQDAGAAYAGSQSPAPQILVHPLGSVGGVAYVVPALVQGHPLVLMERFEPHGWAELVERHRPARGTVPPAGVRMLLDAEIPPHRLASLQLLAVGGGRLEPELQARFESVYGIPVLPAFGATEFAGVVANWSLDLYRQWGDAKRGSAGRASANVELRIVDPETLSVLPPGEVGLLDVRATRLGADWVRATDLAAIDADGFLWLHGRTDGAINRGGFKIVPDHVAGVLRQHPEVADAAVCARPDPRLGEVPVAAVELVRAADLDGETLRAWLKDRLLAHEVPVEVRIVTGLPRNAAMKVSLAEVKALLA